MKGKKAKPKCKYIDIHITILVKLTKRFQKIRYKNR